MKRKLGKSEIEVSALGLGCWAIGGPWVYDSVDEQPIQAGWGQIDDAESIRALHAGLEMGVNFFDTAANYGAGHSEHVLGKALKSHRDDVVIATKFGYVVDEEKKFVRDDNTVVVQNLREDCENSLRRLNTDYIDLYQLHVGDFPPEQVEPIRELLEKLVKEGKIRWYGWSTDNAEAAAVFAKGKHCAAIQQAVHWASAFDYVPTLEVCEINNLASIIRGPLAMGLLTGKFRNADVEIPADDVRHDWNQKEGRVAEIINTVEQVREIMTSDGRSLAQGALGWLWARSPVMIPIPGFKSVAQVQDNAGALAYGPLSEGQMQEIENLMRP
jgi:aryl-alcohol dehydrogenase-like predicted oxidoreductase